MVDVDSYEKADGTQVRAHTRAAPKKRTGLFAGVVVLSLMVSGTGEGVIGSVELAPNSGQATKPSTRSKSKRSSRIDRKSFKRQRSRDSTSCVLHSYREVQQFFVTHPCKSLRRVLFVVPDGDGNEMLVAVSWTEMPASRGARELKDLADRYGTGNVADLARELPGFNSVRFTGKHYDSRPSGKTVGIAEVEPWKGNPSESTMDMTAELALAYQLR